MIRHIVCGIFALVFMCSCTPPQEPFYENEIPGEYFSVYYGDTDTLRIYKDGYYEHEYKVNGKRVIEKDRWEILKKSEDNTNLVLVLSSFSFRQKDGGVSDKMDWFAYTEKSSRVSFSDNDSSKLAIRLYFNIDLDYSFIKKQN